MSSNKEGTGTTGRWPGALAGNSDQVEGLHTGKWTKEEEAYVEGLIEEFQAGFLALPDGTSLRQFLARMLNCNPKRVSKKFEGSNYARGRKFYLKSTEKLEPEDAAKRRKKLNSLERIYKAKLKELKMPHLLSGDSVADEGADESGDGIAASLISDSATAYSSSTTPSTPAATTTSASLSATQSTSLSTSSLLNQSGLAAAGLTSLRGASDPMASPGALLSLFGGTAGNTAGHDSLNDRLLLAHIQSQQNGTRHLSNSLGDLQRLLGSNLSSLLPQGAGIYSGNLSSLPQLLPQTSQRGLDLFSMLGDSQANHRERLVNAPSAAARLGNDFLTNPASEASLLANGLQGNRRENLVSSLMSLGSSPSVSMLQQGSNNNDISLQLQRLLQNQSGQSQSTAAPFASIMSVLQDSLQRRSGLLNDNSNSLLHSNTEAQNLLQRQLQLMTQHHGQNNIPENRGQKRQAEGEVMRCEEENARGPRRRFEPRDDEGKPPGSGRSGWV